MADIIGHVQVASVPERHEPFTGELDDGRVFEAVDRIGYRGFVGCEYRPAGETIAGLGLVYPGPALSEKRQADSGQTKKRSYTPYLPARQASWREIGSRPHI